MERKEIIVLGKERGFYKVCYRQLGYDSISEEKRGRHYALTLERAQAKSLSGQQKAQMKRMEEKLRVVEIIGRKKQGYHRLFFNLLIHISIFCFQAVIFSAMKLQTAHPQIMIQAGVLLLQILLLAGLGMKIKELFGWNLIQKQLKQEAVNIGKTVVADEAREEKKEYFISTLFTRGIGFSSNLIYYTTGRQYTHAAIGLGTDRETFYSFNFKGFKTEHPSHRRLRKGKKNSLYYLFRVSEEEYRQLEEMIAACQREKEKYKYNLAGTIFCVLHIYLPFKRRYDYFCSEFVSEQLRQMKSFRLKKSSRMYLPNHLAKILSRQPNLCQVRVNEL